MVGIMFRHSLRLGWAEVFPDLIIPVGVVCYDGRLEEVLYLWLAGCGWSSVSGLGWRCWKWFASSEVASLGV